MNRLLLVLTILMLTARLAIAQADKPYLFQNPTTNMTTICFSFAGDLWTVPREGGDARRLTTGVGVETDPHYSPDGSMIAFTGEYDGNVDVYVVSAAGGVPKRLTYHPAPDQVVGWTPDGKRILFRSYRESYADFFRLYTIPAEGGAPTMVPLPIALEGSYSADSTRMAYVPHMHWQAAWKRYRGGQTWPIWIADLKDSSIQKVPRDNSNDFDSMWIGGKIYFLSDRNGPVTLFSYDTGSRKVTQVVKNNGLDIKSASLGPDAIVYEQFGALNLYNLATGKSTPVNVRIAADLPEVRPHFVKVAKVIQNADLSPTGARAVFEARGEIITVPVEKGDARNLTNTPGVAERDPAWSPDGKQIAYFCDESGDYALHFRAQSGTGEVRKIPLGSPSYFYSPVWSPDGKKIAISDKRMNVWYVSIEIGDSPVKVDTGSIEDSPLTKSWSPDSKWIAYSKKLKNHMSAIFIYSLSSGKTTQITDGMSDSRDPVFDKSGKYLYFTASTNVGLTVMGADMSSNEHPVTRSAYVVVLRNDLLSPLSPESDEEKAADEKKDIEKKADTKTEKKDDKPVRIDFDNIGQRILALPVPARNYASLNTGKDGILYLAAAPTIETGPPELTLYRFDLAARKAEQIVAGIRNYVISRNGEKLLYQQGENWSVTGAGGAVKPGDGALKIADLQVYVDPRAEWRQMYRETWRIERDFFYDPGYHGLDIVAAEKRYAIWLDNLASRKDLNYLFEEMLGELTVGHMFVGGGDAPEAKKVKSGLLGADYRFENGHVRFARVYNGENWNPQLRAPLTQPGVNVREGEYLFAVNGRDVPATEEMFAPFEETGGKQIVLKVGPNADGKDAREVTVIPVAEEKSLRYLAWIEGNRRKVDLMSGGRLAYVHLPDTGTDGFTSFNRYFFAQIGRDGAVLDERYNHGGQLADYIIDYLRRPIMSKVVTREGQEWNSPTAGIYGPKAMIINEMAGSGGDAMPWYFRKAGIGPLIGKRTWGGLVGIGGYPPLIDGGGVTAPRMAIYGLKGEWEVENVGISPDIDVEFDPKAWRDGHDPQLEKAVEVVMEALKKNPPAVYKRPAYPNYHKGK